MYKIHYLNKISEKGTALWTEDYALGAEAKEADAMLVRSASLHEMEMPESLLAIGRAGAGVNNIPLTSCADEGIVVFNTPGANANSVMELALCGMLLACRDIVGGMRASIYNAMPIEGVEKLVSFMKDFEAKNL